MPSHVRQIKEHLGRIVDELVGHDGYGEFRVEMRLLKRGQKEVLIRCGKQYRYVIDFQPTALEAADRADGEGAAAD